MVQAQPRRVALVASSFLPHTGGVETHVQAVARELVAAGDVVEVWTVDRGETLGEGTFDEATIRYLPAPLPARDAWALARFAVAVPRALVAWCEAMRSLRPQVLHVHCFGPNGVYALLLHHLSRTPLVVTSHGETFMDDHGVYDRSALLRAALRRAVASALVVTAPTEFVLADLRRRFGLDHGVVVPNGIDLQPPASDPVGLPVGRPVVLAVGRVERMKGFDLLLAAAVDPRLEHVRVVIGGDGTQTMALRAQAEQLGIQERVRFLGRLTPGEVASAMAAADVVVVPSRHEAFGIVALEAWRSGTPLVGTIHGGMPEFVTDGVDGLLVDPTDSEALTAGVARLLTDDGLSRRLAAAGRARVQDFGWEMVAALYRRLYANAEEVRGG